MARRFAAIWFRHLCTDWMIRRQPALRGLPFVMALPEQGRMVVKEVSTEAKAHGIHAGMVVADGRAILPALQVFELKPGQSETLLHALAGWCIRYTPAVAVDPPNGLLLDITGCAHLWGGEVPYLKDILSKFKDFGYHIRVSIADTIGAAWGNARYGRVKAIIGTGEQAAVLDPLPPAALRLDPVITERLVKLGLYNIGSFMHMPQAALRRRFGPSLGSRLRQALGIEAENLRPVHPAEPYQERLPCLEPIRTRPGIEIALRRLLDTLCARLEEEGKGLRSCCFKAYRIDGNIQQLQIGTNRGSRNAEHLFKLFHLKISTLYPDLGFEVFLLEAGLVEPLAYSQHEFWAGASHKDTEVIELLDRVGGKMGMKSIHRYLPDAHYWPERSLKEAGSFEEKPAIAWRTDLPRPLHLLRLPHPIEVMVLLPDYPPMNFRYRDQVHQVSKADGPERIEQEWWLEQGVYRDYYCVEDEEGARYWLFRSGSYYSGEAKWFLHGFFA